MDKLEKAFHAVTILTPIALTAVMGIINPFLLLYGLIGIALCALGLILRRFNYKLCHLGLMFKVKDYASTEPSDFRIAMGQLGAWIFYFGGLFLILFFSGIID